MDRSDARPRLRLRRPAVLRRRERRRARPRATVPRAARTTAGRDPFELDLRADERLKALYLDGEKHDGYLRDRDVFAPASRSRTTSRSSSTTRSGATLSYSLNAHCPVGGLPRRGQRHRGPRRARGRRARRRARRREAAPGARSERGRPPGSRIAPARRRAPARAAALGGRPYEVPIDNGDGGHGGGDALLLSDLFVGPGDDPLARPADWRDGVRSIAVGIAGNRSLESGLPVRVADLGIRLPPGASRDLARSMSRIVVTGGAGRLGRSVVAGLAGAGHEVVSLDRDVSDAPSSPTSRRSPSTSPTPDAAARAIADAGADAARAPRRDRGAVQRTRGRHPRAPTRRSR